MPPEKKKIYCSICNQKVHHDEWEDHQKSPQHLHAMETTEIECSLCKTRFLLIDKEKHKESDIHQMAVQAKHKEEKIIHCKICEEDVPTKHWKDHQQSPRHLQALNTEVECPICKEKYLLKDEKQHNKSEEHKKKAAKMIHCSICKEMVPRYQWKDHPNSPRHLNALEMTETECNLCKTKFFLTQNEEHKKSEVHRMAIEAKNKEDTLRIIAKKQAETERPCTICRGKFIPKDWDQHKASDRHVNALQQRTEGKKVLRASEEKEEEKYFTLREGSVENQQYINTLTVFLAVRFALKTTYDFKLSINNDEWHRFGDIVFEFPSSEQTRVKVIRCKKTENRDFYTSTALGARSGNLSLKEHYEMMKKLAEKNNYKNATFTLHTVSSLNMGETLEFTYNEEMMKSWKLTEEQEKIPEETELLNRERGLWKDKKIEIKPFTGKKDLFNSTDDPDDMINFESQDEDLRKFRMYFNQKQKPELKSSITTMIEDVFNARGNISEQLIRFVQKRFKTDKVPKRKEQNLKLSREDFLQKIAELLLMPYVVQPAVVTHKKLTSWNKLTDEFDLIIIKNDDDLVEKIYTGINYVVQQHVEYNLNAFNKVKIKDIKIVTEKLKSKLFNFDGTIQFLHFALWKAGLIPVVLKVTSEKQIETISNVADIIKSQNCPLKLIVMSNLSGNFSANLKVFRNLSDLRFVNDELLQEILAENINLLNFEIPLANISDCNDHFLDKLTSDVLLNVFFKQFSFVDVADVSITKQIVDDTFALEETLLDRIGQYFEGDGNVDTEQKMLSYLLSVNEQPSRIQVPPRL